MSGAPDLPASGMLHVQVAEDCTLDGGTWHLTTDQRGAPTAQISRKRNGHDPWVYLRDVLTRLPAMLPGASEEDLLALLSHRWQPI